MKDIHNCFSKLNDPGKPALRRLGILPQQLRAFPLFAPILGDAAERCLAPMRCLPPHPDVVPALERLRDAGFRLATLTNSSKSAVVDQMQNAGLARFFESLLSVEEVGLYKPHAHVYRWLLAGSGLIVRVPVRRSPRVGCGGCGMGRDEDRLHRSARPAGVPARPGDRHRSPFLQGSAGCVGGDGIVFQTFLENLRPICSGPGYPTQRTANARKERKVYFFLPCARPVPVKSWSCTTSSSVVRPPRCRGGIRGRRWRWCEGRPGGHLRRRQSGGQGRPGGSSGGEGRRRRGGGRRVPRA